MPKPIGLFLSNGAMVDMPQVGDRIRIVEGGGCFDGGEATVNKVKVWGPNDWFVDPTTYNDKAQGLGTGWCALISHHLEIVSGPSVGSAAKPGAPKVISSDDRWPHCCPACGKPSYIGLTKIEHRDGACG